LPFYTSNKARIIILEYATPYRTTESINTQEQSTPYRTTERTDT